VDVRIISATNRDLTQDVTQGKFREDLFYRLNVFPLDVPPLRERMGDLPELVRHFIGRFNAQEGTRIAGATAQTMGLLKAFEWPGNVRQLENAVFRAVVLCEGSELEVEDFPHISGVTRQISAHEDECEEALVVTPEPAANDGPVLDADGPVHITNTSGHIRRLEAIERDLIEFAIGAYAGHMSEIARRLGIGRSTLYRKVREHDLDPASNKATG